MKNYIGAICILLLASPLLSQQIEGIVKDAKTNTSLVGVIVTWQNTRSGTVTDASGKYSITRPPNASALIFSYVGYRSDTIIYAGEATLDHLMAEDLMGATVVIEEHVDATSITGKNPQLFQIIGEKELCKAACCNLSESFETSASIDASFADAITGTRQIKMLGLDGKYTQMMFDNMPAVRGLASTYGLTYVPGTWIKNIYIAKGVGSVSAGYESITGQINVAFKNPSNAEHLAVNGYGGTGGRLELNIIWKPKSIGERSADLKEDAHSTSRHKHYTSNIRFHPVFLAHGALSTIRTDHNKDGFMDNPVFSNVILRNEWHLETKSGWGGQYSLSYLRHTNVSGKREYDPLDEIRSQLWGVQVTTDRYDLTAKTGYVFPNKEWKSVGSQISGSSHKQYGNYGYRQYAGNQQSLRANLLYSTRIKNDNHKIIAGTSYQLDNYDERIFFKAFPPVALSSFNLSRYESVVGAFTEYTWNYNDRIVTVLGARADYHNVFHFLFTPRIHTRFSLSDKTSIKVLSGKGHRTPSLLMDNVGMLASNREIRIEGNDPNGLFGLRMEEAWNSGVLFTHKFKFNYRDATLSVDIYATQFVNQVVMDIEKAALVRFYNLSGKSYSNSAQAEFQWSPIKRLEWRLAYRWLDVKTQYDSLLLEKPLINKHRAFTNLAYSTKEKKNQSHWRFDATLQWISRKRIPYSQAHTDHTDVNVTYYSDAFIQLNAQVTYAFFKRFEVYVGGENLTNYVVHDAILAADNPSSEFFDGSLVWGPVFGRMGYAGFRWSLE